jgi:radical SAM superfamily enzyme YgiQ (UPF0313 family)
MYTDGLFSHLCKKYGVKRVPASKADAFWVSVCDPDDLPLLIKVRRMAGRRPVIMGGFEGYFPAGYLAWADYVVAGEGFEFVEAWADSPQKALSLPCVMSRDLNEVVPSYRLDWNDCPLVRPPQSHRYYFLAGRGCKYKCKFCATSWTCPHQVVPEVALDRIRQQLGGKSKLNLISNDSDSQALGARMTARSVTVRDYIKDPGKYRADMLHFGIEGWTEEQRKFLGKPIPDDHIRALIEITAQRKQNCEFFFIVGFPGMEGADMQRFAENVIPVDARYTPSIHFKLTYFDPIPHSPLGYAPAGRVYADHKKCFTWFNSHNKRVRLFPARSLGCEAWRSALRRCTPEQALRLGPDPKTPNKPGSLDNFRSRLNVLRLLDLLDEQDGSISDKVKTAIKLPKGGG